MGQNPGDAALFALVRLAALLIRSDKLAQVPPHNNIQFTDFNETKVYSICKTYPQIKTEL